MNSTTPTELSGIRKAAILLVLLGDSVASTICDHLPQESLRALAEEISSLGDIPDDTANLVLKEYESMSGPKKPVIQGGPEYAEKVLMKASATGGNGAAVHEIIASSKTSAQALEVLRTSTPERLANALK